MIAFFRMPDRWRDRGPDDAAAAAERARLQRRHHRQLRTGGRADQRRFRHPQGSAGAISRAKGCNGCAVDLGPAEPRATELPAPHPQDIAFLQYTSGSTSDPKGVAVSHANLLANLEMIRVSLGNTRQSTYVNWVPLYHDMGLILNALQALYVGALCVLMAPNAFMQRPLNWLRAIHHYRAEVGCSPNFGYDLCVSRYRAEQMEDVDLSSWKVALNGAEPVHADTIGRFSATFAGHGFRSECCVPGLWHGGGDLADLRRRSRRRPHHPRGRRTALQAHIVGTPADQADVQILVGCGRALVNEQIAIVDPDSRRRLPPDRVGEIWVSGPNVARAYWRNPEATRTGLNARNRGRRRRRELASHRRSRLPRRDGRAVHHRPHQGPRHHPGHQSLSAGYRAHRAGAAPGPASELRRGVLGAGRARRRGAGRRSGDRAHRAPQHRFRRDEGTDPRGRYRSARTVRRHIVLIKPGALPKTTSGKIQRSLARRLWLEQHFEDLAAEAD